jgi:hypothetical protein
MAFILNALAMAGETFRFCAHLKEQAMMKSAHQHEDHDPMVHTDMAI